MDKGICCQAWLSEFNLQDPQGRREPPPPSPSLAFTCAVAVLTSLINIILNFLNKLKMLISSIIS